MTIAARIAVLGSMLVQACMAAPEVSIPVTAPRPSEKEIQRVEPKLPVRSKTIYATRSFRTGLAKEPLTYIPINGLDDLFGGWETFGVAAAPDRVDLIRLRHVKKDALAPGDYSEESAMDLSLEDAAVLRATLTSDGSYDWEQDYDCVPVYDFRVKFQQDKKLVCVDLCFKCRTLRVVRDGREIASKNFEFGYDALAAVIERHYPGVLAGFTQEERPPAYSTRQLVPPKESEILTGRKAEQLIASADQVLISSEDAKEGMSRFVTDRDWIQRVAAAMGGAQLSRSTHCFCIGWNTASFSKEGKSLITISAIHGNQLRIHSKIASGDYPISETQWKVVASMLDEQKLAQPTSAEQ